MMTFEIFLFLTSVVTIMFVAATAAKMWLGVESYADLLVEIPGRLVPRPFLNVRSVRRAFISALTSQRVLMPSGDVLAGRFLMLRMAPEDVSRLAPHGTTLSLETDAAVLYTNHAQREGWTLHGPVAVSIVLDERLRPGWIPPAQIVSQLPPTAAATPPIADPDGRDSGTEMAGTAAMTSTRAAPAPAPRIKPLVVSYGADDYRVREARLGLGRNSNGMFALAEPTVSWKHAMLEFLDGQWFVRDLQSRNGTSVDGTRLPRGGRVPVSRAIVQLGDAVVRVRVDDE